MTLKPRIWSIPLLFVALWCMRAGSETSEVRVDLQKREMLHAMKKIRCDTWFYRWFPLDDNVYIIRSNDQFRQMLRKSREMEPAARAIFADPDLTTEVKTMAIRMMQCLPADRYLNLVRFLVAQIRLGSCPVSLLSDALYPGDWWGTGLALFPIDSNLEAVLAEVEKAAVGNKSVTETLKAIRDGAYADYLRYLFAAEDAQPLPVNCDQ